MSAGERLDAAVAAALRRPAVKRIGVLLNSLAITGLSALWFTTLMIVVAVRGHMPSVTAREMPSSLFSFGGVFGMQRPTLEVIWRVTCAGLLGVGALGVCDVVYARRTKARWFALHVIANAWIALLTLPDVWFIVSDPITALKTKTTNHWPTSLVFSVHVYHMLFFRNLYFIDWLHHLLMVVVGAPVLITGEQGPLMNFNHFFMCGIPGGLDYAMLFAVKHGWMSPLREKQYNSSINVWFRAPFLIIAATFAYIQNFIQDGVPTVRARRPPPPALAAAHSPPSPPPPQWILVTRAFLMVLACWNALFFMERVVGNFHVSMYKKTSAKSAQAGGTESPYAADEHFSGGVPGIGMRVSVSKQELAAIDAADVASILRDEAYPAKKHN